MTSTLEDKTEWMKLHIDTKIKALCVKSINREPNGFSKNFGRLAKPEVVVGDLHTNEALHMLLRSKNEEVVVIGHPDDAGFIWKGTPQEYIETWVVD